VREIPHKKALVERYGNKGFAILGINTDKEPEKYRAGILKHEVTWTNLFNGSTRGGVPDAWGVSRYPTTFLLDAEGRIRYRGLRGEAIAPKVEELLAEMSGKTDDSIDQREANRN